MFLKTLTLHNFRSYKKNSFTFSPDTTLIIGPNTVGKTNLIEAMYLLSKGKSFKAEKDFFMIAQEKEMAKVKGEIVKEDETVKVEAMITAGLVAGIKTPLKKFMVNGVAKRRIDFAVHFPTVLFSPIDLDIVIAGPSSRRHFLDEVLEQVDREYALALLQYTKALRQRNALLALAKETGRRNAEQFAYWDELLITTAGVISQKRQAFITFMNNSNKEIIDCIVTYDCSVMSRQRLDYYFDAESGAGITLVGPHRDDFFIDLRNGRQQQNVKQFGSRGQQRLVVLQLKLLQVHYIEEQLGMRPTLLLDDIFSELDEGHIHLVLDLAHKQQTIITTTHKEFVPKQMQKKFAIIELKRT